MRKIIVEGGKLLEGDIYIQGSKNSSLAVIVASLLCKERVVIQNVAKIQDVLDLLEIIKLLNVNVEYVANVVIIDSRNIIYNKLTYNLIKKFRASYYFMGVMLSLFKKCEIYSPGGCNLGDRPIDMHIDAFKRLGVEINCDKDIYYMESKECFENKIRFKQKSVGATINTLLYASSIDKEIALENISIEPEVIQVIEALRLMGVDIKLDNDTCFIKGRNKKHGFMISIIPDRIEAGTYALIGAAVGKEIRIHQVEIDHLSYLFNLFNLMNVKYKVDKNCLTVYQSNDLRGIEIETLPYPGFPTDLQQPLTALLTKAKKDSVIKETIYKDRTAHIIELNKMGASIKVEGRTAVIDGVKSLVGSKVRATDLRAGAAMVIAGLIADGETEIVDIEHIDRGYPNIEDKFRALGANIRREDR